MYTAQAIDPTAEGPAFGVICLGVLDAPACAHHADELEEQSHIEDEVEDHRPAARTTGAISKQPKRCDVAHCRCGKLDDLELRHEALPPHRPPEHAQKVVVVHNDVHAGVEEETQKREALHVLHPRPGHEQHDSVVVHVQEEVRRRPALEELNHCIEQLPVL
eukprot:CAMPEP_0183334230 /NCGR_PEP_ID=MMETSP0164_2-20130417/2892_1 /TAXON_ID=221442 /ORGANISM="Coccolithus pelagicus ssp braarudi, Strain PLY182g" /LENGTH=161 /DNA_ID=CAMNT_0025503331 /DNA_START=67 /DNA_END=553 /DNA_ORIENTATION=-